MSSQKTPAEADSDLETLLSSKEVIRRLLGGKVRHATAQQDLILFEAAARGEAEAPELSSTYDAVLDRSLEYGSRAMSLPKGERLRFQKATTALRSGGG